MTRVIIVVALICGFGLLAHKYGGATAIQDYINTDKKGAENVRDTAKQTLDGIDPDADPDSLLQGTNGLRDD